MPPNSANSQPPPSASPQPAKSSPLTAHNLVLLILLILSLIGNIWLFMSWQSSKNNSDSKVQAAVTTAKAQQKQSDQQSADQAAKAPYKTFTGPVTFGSITFNYPKTYSVYEDTTSTSEPINAYFYPDIVPSPQAKLAYALRMELTSQAYADILSSYSNQISQGTVKALAYLPPKLKNVANVTAGTMLTGSISPANQDAKGTLVVIKVRDKTLKIYDESTNFDNDFNNIVLPSLSFKP